MQEVFLLVLFMNNDTGRSQDLHECTATAWGEGGTGSENVSFVRVTGKDEAGSALLSTVKLTVAKSDSSIQLDSGTQLRLIPSPTPRWPDLLSVSSDADHILFSSKVGRHPTSPNPSEWASA